MKQPEYGHEAPSFAAKSNGVSPQEARSESLAVLVWLAELARTVEYGDGDASGSLENPPTTIGPFRLNRLLGSGAYGAVFRAFDTDLERWVALKVAWPHVMFDAVGSRRFVEEPKAAASLDHPGILKVHRSGSAESIHYIALELIEGPTLGTWLKQQQQVSFRLAAQIVRQVAEAIHFAHQRGVIHRDIKPSNILLRPVGETAFPYQPVVGDFGLARRPRLVATSNLTGTHDVLGTDPYTSPEQLEGRSAEVGPASDVFSLGVILYELVARRRPFDGETGDDTRWRIKHDDPPAIRPWRNGVPKDLETIALKCLEKSPARRYRTAQDLAADLQRYLSGEPILGRRTGVMVRGWKYAKRKPLQVSLVALVVFGATLVAGLTGAWISDRMSAANRIASAEAATAVAEGIERQHQYIAAIRNAAESHSRQSRLTTLEFLDQAEHLARPPIRRGIEWDYLWSKAHNYDVTIDASQTDILTVRFLNGGGQLMSVDKNGRVVIWDSSSWKSSFEFDSGLTNLSLAEPSPDGSLLAVSQRDGRLIVYRTVDGEKVFDKSLLTGQMLAVAWLGDSGRLAVVGEDAVLTAVSPGIEGEHSSIALVGKETGGRRLDMASLQYIPAHDLIAVVTNPGGLQMLDAKSLEVSDSPFGKAGEIPPCSYLGPQRDALLAQRGNALHLVSLASEQTKIQVEQSVYVRAMSVAPSGLSLALALHDGTVEVWDIADLAAGHDPRRKRFSAHSGLAATVDFSSDGEWLASGGGDGQIRVWRSGSFEDSPDTKLEKNPWYPTFSPCGRWLTVVSASRGKPGQVNMFDARTGRRLWQSAEADSGDVERTSEITWLPVEQATFDAEGDEVVVLLPDFSLHGYDPQSGCQIRTYHTSASATNPPRWFRVSPDGNTIIIWFMKEIEVIDRGSGTSIVRYPAFQTRELGYFRTRLGDLWLRGDPNELKLRLFSSRDGAPVLSLPSFVDAAHASTTSADGRYLAIGGLDGTIYVWDLTDPKLPIQCIGHESPCIGMAFSPDNQTLVSHAQQEGVEGSVRFWHVPTGVQLLKIGSIKEPVLCMGLSPLGNSIALALQRVGGYRIHLLRFDSRKSFGLPGPLSKISAER